MRSHLGWHDANRRSQAESRALRFELEGCRSARRGPYRIVYRIDDETRAVSVLAAGQPRELGPILARVDTGRGREQLFLDQVPEALRHLSGNARIASITASNAIEGIVVDSERAIKIAEGAPRFRNRNEKEFAGYRDAIDGLMRLSRYEPLSIPFMLHLHRQLFQHAGGRGGHLKTDPNYIVSYESGQREVVFEPPPPHETEHLLGETFSRYRASGPGSPILPASCRSHTTTSRPASPLRGIPSATSRRACADTFWSRRRPSSAAATSSGRCPVSAPRLSGSS
jgi:hypothetical protein